MEREIYYFSGTGNSLAVARDISKEIDAKLISVSSVVDKEEIKTNAKILVVVFPVYMWGIPLIIKRFISSIENIEQKSIYAVATNGGIPGAAINILDRLIKSCGGQLSAGFTVSMPGNYTPMYGAISEEKQMKKFDAWKEKIKNVVDYIVSNKRGKKENSNFIINIPLSGLFYKISKKHIPEMDKSFWVDERCNSCGICEKVCPVNNISIVEDKPAWNKHCEQCLACLQWCPVESIQHGKKTKERKRYHHPDINVNDIISVRSK